MKTPSPLCFALGLLALAGPLSVPGADGPKPPAGAVASANIRNVGVEEFDKLRADPKNTVLDVRTAGEFAKGHIPGAVNLDVNAPDFQKKVSELDKNKTYLVHCAAGVRSSKACIAMDNLQFKNLVNLEAGFRAWEKAGKPVDKK